MNLAEWIKNITVSKPKGGKDLLTVATSRPLDIETLEPRVLYDAAPDVSVSVSDSSPMIGEDVTINLSFDNIDADEAGFGPYIDLFIDRTGADGVYDENDGGNPGTDGTYTDTPDGLDVATSGAIKYLGQNVNYTVYTLGEDGTLLHPYARDNTNTALTIYTSDALANDDIPAGFGAGDLLIVIELPFGSFTPTQPAADITVAATMSNLADAGTALNVAARAGFRYGNDALANPTTDPTLVDSTFSTVAITPNVVEVTKVNNAPEGETATGPNFERQYTINVDVATGQRISYLDILDTLPDNIQFVSLDSVTWWDGGDPFTLSDGGSHNVNTTTPGGILHQRLTPGDGEFVGHDGIDATLTFSFFVPRLDASSNPVINASTGDDASSLNTVSAEVNWIPLDGRDSSAVINSGNVTNTLADRSIAIQKDYTIVNDVGGAGITPGDTIEFTLSFQVSDYFAFQDILIEDVLSDGLRIDQTFNPIFTWTEHGTTYGSQDFDSSTGLSGTNWTSAYIGDTIVNNDDVTVTPLGYSASEGSYRLSFDVSSEMITRGQDGRLLGGGIPDAGTGGSLPNNPPLPFGGTTGTITFRAVVQDSFQEDYEFGDDSLNPRDILTNHVTIEGDLLTVSDASTPTGNLERDTSAETLTIKEGTLTKSVYAVNGTLYGGGDLVIFAGDEVTYRITYTIPSGDVENLEFRDFLPLPIFDAANPNQDGVSGGAGEWSFGSTYTAGVIWIQAADTLSAAIGANPTVSVDTANGANTLIVNYGYYENAANTELNVDFLFTVTVGNDPFADGLYLTNQVQSAENNTQNPASVESNQNQIIQIVLGEPALDDIYKGVVSSSNDAGSTTVGGLTFDKPGAGGFTAGTLDSQADAQAIGALDLNNAATQTLPDAGDVVRYAIVVQNTGRADAYDVTVTDTLQTTNYTDPNSANANAFISDVNMIVQRGDGTILTNGVDFNLVWDNGTDTFTITLVDSFDEGDATEAGTGGLNRGVDTDDTIRTDGLNALVITYELTLAAAAKANATITNTATLTNYSNRDGGEDFTTLDETDTAIVKTPQVTNLTKAIVSTSEAHTTGTDVAIGEIVRYSLTLDVPEGQLTDLQIRDLLPPGLIFLNDGTATVSYLNFDTGHTGPVAGVLGDTAISSSATSNVDTYTAGTDVYFKLGDFTNQDNDANVEQIVIEFNAIVHNDTTSQNNNGESETNRFNATSDNEGANATISDANSNSVTVTTREATLGITQTIISGSGGGSGDSVTYEVTITNSSAYTAFEAFFSDAVPNAVFSSITIDSVSDTIAAIDLVTGDFETDLATYGIRNKAVTDIDMLAGESFTIRYTATLAGTIDAGSDVDTNATVTWTSLPGANGTTGNATGSDTPGASGATNGERDGSNTTGQPNDYYRAATTHFEVPEPTIDKQFRNGDSSTTTDDGGIASTTGANVVIGETVFYDILVTLPEATTKNLVITDTIPDGLRIVNATLITTAAGNALLANDWDGSALTMTPSGAFPGTNDTDYTFSFGDVTANNDNDATDNAFIIRIEAIATNVAASDGGDTLLTPASLTFDDPEQGSTTKTDATPNDHTVTIREPDLTITKAVSPSSGSIDAGDTLTYTIQVSNSSGYTAYEATFIDDLDDVNLVTSGAAITVGNFTTNIAGLAASDFEIVDTGAGDYVLRLKSGVDLDIANGENFSIEFTVDIVNTVQSGTTINNTGTTTWTSTDGANADERDGSGAPAYNDYTDSATVVSSAITPITIVKSITATDHAGTSGTNLTIGETATYQLLITLPEGVTPDLKIRDVLAAGMDYVGGSAAIITAAAGSDLTNDFAGGAISFDSVVEGNGAGSFDSADSNDISFDFSSISVTADGNANNNAFIITYQAIVTDVVGVTGTTGSQTDLTNSVRHNEGNGSTFHTETSLTATAVEPNLIVTKTIDDVDAVVTAGQDSINYTITIAHQNSEMTAYDIILDDVIPASLVDPTNGVWEVGDFTVVHSGAGATTTNVTGGNTLTITADSLADGETITITFAAKVASGTAANTNIDNNARIYWDNNPGDAGGDSTNDVRDDGTKNDGTPDRDYGATGVDEPHNENDADTQDTVRVTTGNATISDTVWEDVDGDNVKDAGESGLNGVRVYVDFNNNGILDGNDVNFQDTTDANGNYSITGLAAGTYVVRVDTSTLPSSPSNIAASYDLDGSNDHNASVTLTNSQTRTDVDFGYRFPGSVSDLVWEDKNGNGIQDVGESGIANARVYVDIDGSGTFNAGDLSATTDANGNYLISNVPAGTYNVRVDTSTLPTGVVAVYDLDGAGTANVASVAINSQQARTDVDFGYQFPGTIGDTVWHDADGNGTLNGGEKGIANVRVYIDANANDSYDIGETNDLTDANGQYLLGGLAAGNYVVRVDLTTLSSGYITAYDRDGTTLTPDNEVTVALALSDDVTDVDFGYRFKGSIADQVWEDNDKDGIKDAGENGIANVRVFLDTNANGILDGGETSTTTDASGKYSFTNLNPGTYTVAIDTSTLSTGFIRVYDLDGIASKDSITLTVASDQDRTDIDFGYQFPGSFGDVVWEDSDSNGVQSSGEKGLSNVRVFIDANNNGIFDAGEASTLTDSNGKYTFSNYAPGTYTVAIDTSTLDDDFSATYDLDGKTTAHKTTFTLSGSQYRTDIDFGYEFFSFTYDTFNNFSETPATTTTETTTTTTETVEEKFRETPADYYTQLPGRYDHDTPFRAAEIPVTPIYSGEAEPGSFIVITLYNANGQAIGTETVVADTGGNWLAKFPSSVIVDYPQTVVVSQTSGISNQGSARGFNLRPYYTPASQPGHFSFETLDPNSVEFKRTNASFLAFSDYLANPLQFGSVKSNYESLPSTSTPSSYY